MKNTKRTSNFVVYCFIILSFLLFFPVKSRAAVLFYDDFDDNTYEDNWISRVVMGNDENYWYLQDGSLYSNVGSNASAHLYVKDSFDSCNYVIESNAEAIVGLDQSYIFRISDDFSKYYMVDFRFHDPSYTAEYGNNYRLWKYISTSANHSIDDYHKLGETSPVEIGSSDLVLGQEINVRIEAVGNSFKIYHDGVLVFDYVDDSESFMDCGGYGLRSWGGNHISTNRFLYYKVSDVNSVTPEIDQKIIVLPGLGASWNERAMVFNEVVSNEDWRMTPFVNNYSELISAFEQKGLVKGEDFFVWNYDWRKPVSEIVDNFDEFVGQNVDSGSKLDLVGHSLGGLVARTWYQENLDKNIGKVVSIGSPHFGAVKAYESWYGGRVSDKTDVSSIAMNILLQLQKKNFESNVATVRVYASVVKDLLPVFNYLKNNGVVRKYGDMKHKNDYLMVKNSVVDSIFPKFEAVTAIGVPTLEWINVKKRSVFDEVLGYWEDGKPVSYVTTKQGDGTVLKKSAIFGSDEYVEVVSNHGDMVNESIGKVFDLLGLGEYSGGGVYEKGGYDNGLLFYLGSPARMKVTCGGEVKEDQDGFVFFKNPAKNCSVNLQGTGSGTYHLVVGSTFDKGKWSYYEDEIVSGREVKFEIDSESGVVRADQKGGSFLYGLILRDLRLLEDRFKGNSGLKLAVSGLNKKDWEKVLTGVFNFRKSKNETLVSGRIINNLVQLIETQQKKVNGNKAKVLYRKVTIREEVIDRLPLLKKKKCTSPNKFQSLSYQYYQELKELAKAEQKKGDWAKLYATSLVMDKLLDEVRF